jgi:hypothetical protein
MKKTVVSLLGLVGFVAFGAQANAAPAQTVVRPDLNGDGRADTVIAKVADDNPEEQVLTATVKGRKTSTRLQFDGWTGVLVLRVVDLNADGKQEIIVRVNAGANTDHFSVVDYANGTMRTITNTDGTLLRFFEGGGMSAVSDYGCETAGGAKRLATVGAVLDWDTMLYTGDRTTYTVQNGVATEVSRTTATGPRDLAAFQVNPAACA